MNSFQIAGVMGFLEELIVFIDTLDKLVQEEFHCLMKYGIVDLLRPAFETN